MTLNEIQELFLTNSAFPEAHERQDIRYFGLALAGEAGEVADEIKKLIRDDNYIMTDYRDLQIKKELANLFYYVCRTATELDISMENLAELQLKLCEEKRKARSA
jgi:NTP pyrophosphatase (non-canonical NTP hydrolase)